jgi:hypothetical protein
LFFILRKFFRQLTEPKYRYTEPEGDGKANKPEFHIKGANVTQASAFPEENADLSAETEMKKVQGTAPSQVFFDEPTQYV